MTKVRRTPPGRAGQAGGASPEPLRPSAGPDQDGADGAGTRGDPASCSPEARRRALEAGGLGCPECGSRAVVPKVGSPGRYLCCACARLADFLGWVRFDR